jgi:ABC-2 type transport system ATP-binding protein
VVIGRGRVIAESSMADFVANHSDRFVRVRTPVQPALIEVLTDAGASVTRDDEVLRVVGLTAEAIGDLAGAHHLVLHELAPHAASLEDAFMELTHDSVEFRGEFTNELQEARSA